MPTTKRRTFKRAMRTAAQNAFSAAVMASAGYLASGEWWVAAVAGGTAALGAFASAGQNFLENRGQRRGLPLED